MAKKFGQGFEITGYDPIDVRLILTKEQMANIVGDEDSGSNPDDFAMPEIYFAFCIDDGCFYKFDYEATPDPETGKFTKLELGGSTPTAESGPAANMPDPDDKNPGDQWYDPETGKTYTVTKDSEGNNQWVEKTPTAGEMMFDETSGKILYFDGNEWKEVGGLNDTAVGPDAPSSPDPGDTWVDSDDNKKYIYVVDSEGHGSWVEQPSKAGEMMYDDTNEKILYFNGTEWKEVGALNQTSSGNTAPSNPQEGDKWLDTSTTPPTLKEYGEDDQWHAVSAKEGDMMYDATNDRILYYDGTQWKPIGGGVEHVSTLPVAGEEGEIVYDESTGQYKIYEDGVWLTMAKTWEGTEAQYTTLGGDAWSTAHPDVILFVK